MYIHVYIYIYLHIQCYLRFWYTDWDSTSSRTHSCKNQPMFNKNNVEDPCRILSWSLIKATWIDQPREQRIKPQDICPIPIFPVNNGNLVDFAFLLLMDRSLQQFNLSIVKKKNIYLIDIYLTTSTLCFLTLPCAYVHMHLELLSPRGSQTWKKKSPGCGGDRCHQPCRHLGSSLGASRTLWSSNPGLAACREGGWLEGSGAVGGLAGEVASR